MDRRLLLAIVLMMVVAIAPTFFLKRSPPAVGRSGGLPDSAPPTPPEALGPLPPPSARPPARPSAGEAADTVWVTSPLYRFGFSTRGAQLVSAQLLEYRSFAPGDSGRAVELVPAGRPLLGHRLVAGPDTVSLADWSFAPDTREVQVGERGALRFTATRGGARVTLTYRFRPDDYRFDVEGQVSGLGPAGALLVLGLGDGLRSVEADTMDDYRNYSIVAKADRPERTDFRALDPGERLELNGPFEWVGIKSKYFLVVALALEEHRPKFGGALAVGGARSGKAATRAAVAVTLAVPQAGEFGYQVYAGPLEYRRQARIGHELDDANPYGGIIRGLIQPVSVGVVAVLLWMHERLNLAYGWVLIIFGLLVRLALWPLNQKAMESSIRMQAVAPLLKATQERYKNDPERLQREMLRLYKEHKVNPLGGCLPMLLPMPVLFALFFVFANTIEFRGVPFFWLPDLSRPDPYYIIPLIMGLSMFVLSKLGQMGVPPNPQTKMLLYFLPVMMTVMFLNFASGLNLYYAASNIFSLPQQYMIARRRLRQAPVPKPA
ncbi:MAG: membrane protein insertase YidC [Gemmatimonadales bacterium]